jgi:hypothetical protein
LLHLDIGRAAVGSKKKKIPMRFKKEKGKYQHSFSDSIDLNWTGTNMSLDSPQGIARAIIFYFALRNWIYFVRIYNIDD